jgi:hypothetical protein
LYSKIVGKRLKQALAYSQGLSSFHYGSTHYVFTSVVLIANGKHLCDFAKSDQGFGQFKKK